jgi:nucleoside-diphosphate-sugar epimerase
MIVLTGANGFVGKSVHAALLGAGKPVRALSRAAGPGLMQVGSMTSTMDWRPALKGATCVIHLAARVHTGNDRAHDSRLEFRQVNVDSTLHLASQAAQLGVKRFVFISSIKVNGETTILGRCFRAEDTPQPTDFYARSKLEAEEGLWELAKATGMEIVIIRPPLVYGPNVRANFGNLMEWISRGFPLPLGAVTENRRSLIAVENLTDLIICCTQHPRAANELFLACDGEDLSTTELIRRIGIALGRPARLVSVPTAVLESLASLVGKKQLAQRLLGSLQVDIAKACEVLGWRPPLSATEGLISAAKPLRDGLRA